MKRNNKLINYLSAYLFVCLSVCFFIYLVVIYCLFFLATVPDGPPSSFSLIVINSTTLKLSWKPVSDREQNGIILNYTIGCNITEFEPTQVLVNDQFEMTDGVYDKVIYGLTPGTIYQCYVYANITEGAGPSAKATNRTFEERKFK